jgi:metal-sulfur cluster biosynthetic enzyme
MSDEKVAAIRASLSAIVDPCSIPSRRRISIVELGLVKSIGLDGDSAVVELQLTSAGCMFHLYFREEITRVLTETFQIRAVQVNFSIMDVDVPPWAVRVSST